MITNVLAAIAVSTLLAAPVSPAQTPTPPPAGVTRTIDLNSASAADLESLPGVGRATAERIVEHRQKHGPFKKIEELMNVKGIGEKSFLRLKPLITAVPPKAEKAGGGR